MTLRNLKPRSNVPSTHRWSTAFSRGFVNFKSVVAVNRYQLSTACSNEGTTWQPDAQSGAPINSNLADYIVPANADAPPIDVHFLDFPDKEINELGARGIGEIGLAGIAAAITAAVHHATGVRVRELPVTIDKLL